jgi:hypothetical protein
VYTLDTNAIIYYLKSAVAAVVVIIPVDSRLARLAVLSALHHEYRLAAKAAWQSYWDVLSATNPWSEEDTMSESTLAQAQQLVDQLTPHDQVRLLAYLTTRLAQVITAFQSAPGGTSPETSDVWETFFQLGDILAATDTPDRETLTAAVLAMRRW